MERIAVRSKDLAIVGYDPMTQVLEITFRGGGVYEYASVPADVHEALMKASSHGIYFRDHVREKYSCKKVH